MRPGAALAAKPILLAKEKDAEPTLNMTERMGVARLTRPEACLAIQGKGFKGQTRGADFKGHLRYMEVDRWKPIGVSATSLRRRRVRPLRPRMSGQGRDFDRNRIRPGRQRSASRPVVHEPCVGCGVCEMICPVEPTCIMIDAREVWKT